MLGKGAGGEVKVVRGSKEEDPFPRASGKFLSDWNMHNQRQFGKARKGGKSTLWKDRETYTPRQLSRQNMSIQHVYGEKRISDEFRIRSSLCFSRSNDHPCPWLRDDTYAFNG